MNRNLDKIIKRLYMAGLLFILCIFLYMCFNIKSIVTSNRPDGGFVLLSPGEFLTLEDEDAPVGAYNELTLTLTDIPKANSELVFCTRHESVEVYIGNELIYSLYPSPDNAFTKTSGAEWNSIPIYPEDSGKTLRVVLLPLYDNVLGTCPDLYFGSELAIWIHLIGQSVGIFLLALTAMILGVIFIVFTLTAYRNREADKSLLLMGVFSICIGLWKITDLDTTALLFEASIPLAYVPYLSLLVVVIPFVLFVKQMFTQKDSIIWYIPCFANLALMFIVCILQITGAADMRDMLWLTHGLMLSLVAVTAVMVWRELKSFGWSGRLKLTLLCLALCFVGLLGDIAIYRLSGGQRTTSLGMFSFLFYIVVLGVNSLKNARRLIAIGSQAKQFEEMAYHDQLTGLYNRTAYAEYTGKKEFSPEGHIVVMFDLNNLKTCNDTLGHDQGDYYIRSSAELIKESFSRFGNCYRMGGDEFCVLLHNVPMAKCQECIKDLKRRVGKWNEENGGAFPIHIACGFKMFNPKKDYDIADTLRRADKMMYAEKFSMKNPGSRNEAL